MSGNYENYEQMRREILKGWNTWSTHSVLSHVLLPYGFCINLMIKNRYNNRLLKNALIGRLGEKDEKIHPGIRSYDGSYTSLKLEFDDIKVQIQTMTEDGNQYILVEQLEPSVAVPKLMVECGFLWNKPGSVQRKGDCLEGAWGGLHIPVFLSNARCDDLHTGELNPVIYTDLTKPAIISTGHKIEENVLREKLSIAKRKVVESTKRYGELAECYNALRTCLAWDTIYEPEHDRICSPVSRIWNTSYWGGYVLFCWDTYFSAWMAMLENKELAYSNAVAITKEITERGFVPNFSMAGGVKSRDRSQPPVGSMVVRELYRKFKDRWLLEELYDDLLTWNRWFASNRMRENGTMSWGSNPYEPTVGMFWELRDMGDVGAAAFESGLDNSHMYDDAGFDEEKGLMHLEDVGLCGMYVMDCEALADIAEVLGRPERKELLDRAQKVKKGISTLWDENYGLFLNRNTVTGQLSRRISATNFYALFSDMVTKEQALRCVNEHYFNPEEFYGEFVIPMAPRNDKAYKDQEYWRGRIWGPTNLLAYLAFRKQGLTEACMDIAEKSKKLLLNEWLEHGHVHENYSGEYGTGCDSRTSDRFYHWGALLGLIAMIEYNYVESPEKPLED